MPQYNYTATNAQGKEIKGLKEADTQDEVAAFLQGQGLTVISIDQKFGFDFKTLSQLQIGDLSLKDRLAFVKQLSAMLAAGLPLIQSLETLVQQTENPALKAKLNRIFSHVSTGITLSEAFKREEAIFSPLQINLIVAGEKSGNLVEVLQRIVVDMEKTRELQSKIRSAMIYPIIIILVLIAVIAAMLIFMVPSVEDLYKDFEDASLPWVTQVLVDLSDFVTSPVGAISIILTVVFVVVGYRYYNSTPDGRLKIDRLKLKLPIFGQLQLKIQLAQFNRLLSMLLKSGMSIVDSLNVIANSTDNQIVANHIRNANKEVIKGNSLTVPLAKDGIFPLILLKMLATGEQTGKLDQVTDDMAKYYEAEVDELTSNLTKAMEPMIMVVVGGVVAFMALAIYLPIYQLGQFVT